MNKENKIPTYSKLVDKFINLSKKSKYKKSYYVISKFDKDTKKYVYGNIYAVVNFMMIECPQDEVLDSLVDYFFDNYEDTLYEVRKIQSKSPKKTLKKATLQWFVEKIIEELGDNDSYWYTKIKIIEL